MAARDFQSKPILARKGRLFHHGTRPTNTPWGGAEALSWIGRKHAVPTPFNAVLQRVANEMAAAREQPGKLTAEELFAMAERLATRHPLP